MAEAPSRVPSPVDRATTALALAGGAVVLLLALVVTASVFWRWLGGGRGVPGDFELVQTGLALAVCAFLPACQLRGANIVVDSFTARAPWRARASLDALWALAYAAVALLLAWRTAVGAQETVASGTTSMVLGLPIGWAMGLASLLAAWLAVVALVTVKRAAAASGSPG